MQGGNGQDEWKPDRSAPLHMQHIFINLLIALYIYQPFSGAVRCGSITKQLSRDKFLDERCQFNGDWWHLFPYASEQSRRVHLRQLCLSFLAPPWLIAPSPDFQIKVSGSQPQYDDILWSHSLCSFISEPPHDCLQSLGLGIGWGTWPP